MSLKSNIQKVVYNQALKKRIRQNKVKFHPFNFAKTKSFGFLLDVSSEVENYTKEIFAFAEKLRDTGKEVTLLAYNNEDIIKENNAYSCFCRKDLNWALVPKGDVIDEFLAREYDVLIDFYLNDCRPLEFVNNTVATHFRIGYYQEHRTALYDFMVHNPEKNIDTMIRQIEYGMGIINA